MQTLQQLAQASPDYEFFPGDQLVLELTVFDPNPLLPDQVEERAMEELQLVNAELARLAPGWEMVPTAYEETPVESGTTVARVRVMLTNDFHGGSSLGMLTSSLVPVFVEPLTAGLIIAAIGVAGYLGYQWGETSGDVVAASQNVADASRSFATAAVAIAVVYLIATWT